MKETGILFSAPMVRALLDGSKTQTRRVIAMPPSWDCIVYADYGDGWWPFRSDDGESPNYDNNEIPLKCPYGYVGDRLWVRETFFAYGRWETRYSEKKKRDEWHFVDMTLECDRAYQYAADNPDVPLAKGRGATPGWWTRPAIFMPRAACRILRDVVSVRVERLNDISESDTRAEGCQCYVCGAALDGRSEADCHCFHRKAAPSDYRHLWEQINGAGSWDVNPFVWVVEFKRVSP